MSFLPLFWQNLHFPALKQRVSDDIYLKFTFYSASLVIFLHQSICKCGEKRGARVEEKGEKWIFPLIYRVIMSEYGMEYVVLPVEKGFSKFLLHVYARKDNLLFAFFAYRKYMLFFFLCSSFFARVAFGFGFRV